MLRNDCRALGSSAIRAPMFFKNISACWSGVYIICVQAFSCTRLISPFENACVANGGTPIVMAVCIVAASSSNVLLSGVWSTFAAIFTSRLTFGMHKMTAELQTCYECIVAVTQTNTIPVQPQTVLFLPQMGSLAGMLYFKLLSFHHLLCFTVFWWVFRLFTVLQQIIHKRHCNSMRMCT